MSDDSENIESNDSGNTESKPPPPSRAYRSKPKKKSKNLVGTPLTPRERPPMPAPPKIVADPEPAEPAEPVADTLLDAGLDAGADPEPSESVAEPVGDIGIHSEASEPVAAATEPYSPYRVPPPRRLPDMVFPTPGSRVEEPKPKSRSTFATSLKVIAAVGVIVVGLIGYNAVTNVAERNQLQGQLTSGAQIGQCYSDQVRFVDCAGEHTYEVFGTNQLQERADYPGVLNRSLGSEACEFRFFNYTGFELAGSSFAIYSVYPSQEQWADGERWELCVLSDGSLRPLTGTSAASVR